MIKVTVEIRENEAGGMAFKSYATPNVTATGNEHAAAKAYIDKFDEFMRVSQGRVVKNKPANN